MQGGRQTWHQITPWSVLITLLGAQHVRDVHRACMNYVSHPAVGAHWRAASSVLMRGCTPGQAHLGDIAQRAALCEPGGKRTRCTPARSLPHNLSAEAPKG
jgi:hypothetical protein